MPSSHLILCRPLLLLPSIPPSIRVFSNDNCCYKLKIVTTFIFYLYFIKYLCILYVQYINIYCTIFNISDQIRSVAQSCPTLCDPMNRSMPGLPVDHKLSEFTQTHVHWVSDAIQPSHPLLASSPLAPNPSSIRVFSNESTLRMRWPKYWSVSFSIIPSKEIPGLISFRMD